MTIIILSVIVGILVLDRFFSFRMDKFDYDYLNGKANALRTQYNDLLKAMNTHHEKYQEWGKSFRQDIEELHKRISERGMNTTEKLEEHEDRMCQLVEKLQQNHSVIVQLVDTLGYEVKAKVVGECSEHHYPHSEVVVNKKPRRQK